MAGIELKFLNRSSHGGEVGELAKKNLKISKSIKKIINAFCLLRVSAVCFFFCAQRLQTQVTTSGPRVT